MQPTAKLLNAIWINDPRAPNIAGDIINDSKNRFSNGDRVYTSTVIKQVGENLYQTRNSLYEVHFINEDAALTGRPADLAYPKLQKCTKCGADVSSFFEHANIKCSPEYVKNGKFDYVKQIADQLIMVENSKNITGIMYSAQEKELFVRFTSGGVYKYAGVPLALYLEFNNSASKGGFFHDKIKNKFECKKVENNS